MFQFVFELGKKIRVFANAFVICTQFLKRMDKRLSHENAAVRTEMTVLVRELVGLESLIHLHLSLLE